VDLDAYYDGYPMQNQQDNFFTRICFSSRLKLLKQGGLKRGSRILDYGCGNGAFVRYLHQLGYHAAGYDPFVSQYSHPAVLDERFDALIAQDVIEHSTEPSELLQRWSALLIEGGLLFIGTPNAEAIDLKSAERYSLEIHQPFHRHIFSKRALNRLCAQWGLEQLRCTSRFYLDTFVPFNNLAFTRAYIEKMGGCLDAAFEAPNTSAVVSSPRLLMLGYFGRFIPSASNLLCVFSKRARPVQPAAAPDAPRR